MCAAFLALGPSYKGVLYLGRQARRRTGYEACRAVRSGGPIFLGVLGTFLGFSCFIYRHMCFYLRPLSAQAGVNEPTRISLVLDIAECAEDLGGCGLGTCIQASLSAWRLVSCRRDFVT